MSALDRTHWTLILHTPSGRRPISLRDEPEHRDLEDWANRSGATSIDVEPPGYRYNAEERS